MNDNMKSISLRLDHYFYEILKTKAEDKGVKLSRFIRTLLERGLTLEGTYSHPTQASSFDNTSADYLAIIADLSAETLMTMRHIYRRDFENEETFREASNRIYAQSQKMLDAIKKSKTVT